MILILFLYSLIALTFTIGKMLLFYVPPIFLIALRMSLAGGALLLFYLIFYGQVKFKRNRDISLLLAVTLLHILIPYVTEYLALQHISPSSAALVYNLSPFFSAFFSYIYFQEKMTIRKWIGFLISLAGVLFFIKPNNWHFVDMTQSANFSFSHLLMLVSVITAALGWIFVRILVKNQGYPPVLINGFAMLLGGLVSFPLSSIFEGKVSLPSDHLGTFSFLLFSIILIANIIFYNLYGYLLRSYSATLLSFVGFITPLFAALFDWLFLHIMVPWEFFASIAIVGVGIYIFYQEELDQGYIAQ